MKPTVIPAHSTLIAAQVMSVTSQVAALTAPA